MNSKETTAVVGIDVAKDVFQIHGMDASGKVILQRQVRRAGLLSAVANMPRSLIGMEACGGAQHWRREFAKLGHEVKLMAPQYVKPYVKTNKNDRADAEAIAEAVTRRNMRFVPAKEEWQQDFQCIHRVRTRLIRNRTALSNEVRGFLHEYGIVIGRGKSKLFKRIPEVLEDADNGLSLRIRGLLSRLMDEYRRIDAEVEVYDEMLDCEYKGNEICRRLGKVVGIGPVTATALVAAAGDGKAFRNGRQMAAWLGLVPRQNSTGGKTVLLGISKRGDGHLRSLLIHGARTAMRCAEKKSDRLSRWVTKKAEARGKNKACVALANKMARIAWVVMARGAEYKMQ